MNIKTGEVSRDQTLLIVNGIIDTVIKSNDPFTAIKTMDAKGQLISPSFIDAHIHPTDVFGDYEKAPRRLHPDSLEILRKKLSDDYLPYGTTTVTTMGQPKNWIKPIDINMVNKAFEMVYNDLSGLALANRLAEALKKVDSAFDIRNYGHNSFRKFLEALKPNFEIVLHDDKKTISVKRVN